MINLSIVEYYPLIYDVYEGYTQLRGQGYDPERARESLLSENAQEMHDEDDAWAVLAGIALAQFDASELSAETKNVALSAVQKRKTECDSPEEKRALSSVIRRLNKENAPSKKTNTSQRKNYLPSWKIGDTFAHLLTHPDAETAGIKGWYMLFRKVGEYIDYRGKTVQLGYVAVCPEDKLPRTSEECNALGFLRVMSHGKKWEYMVQANIQSKRMENTLQMEWIGCFPDVIVPNDEVQRKPEVTMPFFEGIDKGTGLPRYEDVFCRFYRWYGIGGI